LDRKIRSDRTELIRVNLGAEDATEWWNAGENSTATEPRWVDRRPGIDKRDARHNWQGGGGSFKVDQCRAGANVAWLNGVRGGTLGSCDRAAHKG